MKKGAFVVFAFAIIVLAGFASAAIPGSCPGNLVSYWKMDGNAGDSYVNQYNGTGFPASNLLKIGGAADFNGNQKIVVQDTSDDLDLSGGFTIQFWMQKGTIRYDNASIVKKSNYDIKWVYPSDYSGSYIRAIVNGVTVQSNKLVLDGTPYFVSLTHDDVTKNLRLYINGVSVANSTANTFGLTTTDLEFGDKFEGLLDEVAFFDTALSGSDVKNFYDSSFTGRDYCYSAGGGNSTSTTETNFTISGCPLPSGRTLAAGQCSNDKNYYCGNISLFLYNTASDHLGCSYEDYPLPAGDARGCCPQGYYCNATAAAYATNNVKCVQATWRCSDWTTNASCVEHFCYWITPNADPASHYCSDDIGSCSVYMSNTDCNNDYMDLGIIGYGTDQCLDDTVPIECEGKSFVYNGCACEWDSNKFSPGVGGCDLVQTISSDFFNTTTNYTFACKTFFGMGNCTDGEQAIKWNSTLVERGSGGMTPAASEFLKQCVGNKTCKSGESMRFCGDEIVKLPGFSFFALISSITLIIVFYIWRKGK